MEPRNDIMSIMPDTILPFIETKIKKVIIDENENELINKCQHVFLDGKTRLSKCIS